MMSRTARVGSGLFALIAALMLGACGDGSIIADGGIRGTGKSVGPVSGFGSVIVNGVRYETDRTEFEVNGDQLAVQDDLSEGMLVVVDVSANDDDRADRIRYSDDLRGPLAGTFDPLSNQMQVMGQTVRFNSATVFRGLALVETAIAPLYVSVSGWRLDSGDLLASYIRFRSSFDRSRDDVAVRGNIARFNGDSSLQIGDLRVVYSSSTEIEMDDDRESFSADEDVGAYIDVEGELDEAGNLIADEIEEDHSGRLGDISGTGIRIEGAITTGVNKGPSDTFEINGITVRVNPATTLSGGKFADLGRGTRIYIEGTGDTDATVVAKRIEFRDPDAEIEAIVQAIEPSLNNPEREGRLLIGGVQVEVTLRTIMVDDDDDDDRRKLRFRELRRGDVVEVTGIPRQDGDGAYIEAVKLERDDDGNEKSEINGRVTSVDDLNETFVILGVNMTVDDNTDYDDGLRNFSSIEVDQRLAVEYHIGLNGNLLAIKIDRERDRDEEDDDGRGDDDDDEED